jgi:hypothetical protein
MSLPCIFNESVSESIVQRIESLTPRTQAKWGTMNVAQMLAHCNVTYEMVFTDKHPKPNAFVRFMLKSFVKSKVVGVGTYGKSLRTAPQFIISDSKEFSSEKDQLIAYIRKSQQLGTAYFEGKESHSFGKLTADEWNNMFYKHLNHHLEQFGA